MQFFAGDNVETARMRLWQNERDFDSTSNYPGQDMSFFQELKRRNVFRVGFAYVVLAWLVLQVADVILNNITAPDWVFHVLLLFIAVGFPFVLFFKPQLAMTGARVVNCQM